MAFSKNNKKDKYNPKILDREYRSLIILLIHGTVLDMDLSNWNKYVKITVEGEYINPITGSADFGTNNLYFYDVTYFAVRLPDLDAKELRTCKKCEAGNDCLISSEIDASSKRYCKLVTKFNGKPGFENGFEIHYQHVEIQFVS